MAKKTKIDNKRFMEMIKEGFSKKEIMKTFGIKTYAQFDSKYNKVAIEMGLIPAPKRTKAKKKDESIIKIGKRGSITIPKNFVEEFGFKENDEFDIKMAKNGISLKLRKEDVK